MNKPKYYLFFLLVIGIVWSACDKKEPFLIPTIQITPTSPGIFGFVSGVDTSYETPSGSYNNGMFSITTSSGNPSTGFAGSTEIEFIANSTGFYTVYFGNQTSYEDFSPVPMSWSYSTNSSNTGTVHLTLFDNINHIASGTFTFDACGGGGLNYNPSDSTSITLTGFFTKVSW